MIKTIFESCKGLNEFILGRRSIAISTKLDYFEGKKDGQLMVIHSLFLDLRLLQLYIYTYTCSILSSYTKRTFLKIEYLFFETF